MKLDYVGRKSEKEILTKARSLKGAVKNIDNSLLLKGDNFMALSSLLPIYAGKIDLIYIDPPSIQTKPLLLKIKELVRLVERKMQWLHTPTKWLPLNISSLCVND